MGSCVVDPRNSVMLVNVPLVLPYSTLTYKYVLEPRT